MGSGPGQVLDATVADHRRGGRQLDSASTGSRSFDAGVEQILDATESFAGHGPQVLGPGITRETTSSTPV